MHDLFSSVPNAYRALQEWCAPRILVDGTEAYATVAQQAVNEVTNLFITSSTVHLSRNPRECLGECQKMVEPNTLVNLEKNWTKFTHDMSEFEENNAGSFLIRYEDLDTEGQSALSDLFSQLSIPHTVISHASEVIT